MAENSNIIMPPPERAAKTALGTSTIGSYLKADSILKSNMPKGKTLDFGSGKGLGAKAIGADTYEPYVKSEPKYTNTNQIKSNSYDKVTSLNVLNTIEPEGRKKAVKDIGRVLKQNGIAIISTRGKDVEDAKIKTKAKDGYIIGKGDQARFQRGFTQDELKEYTQKTLGKNYKVENVQGLGKAAIKVTKLKATPTPLYKTLSLKGANFPMGKLTKRFNEGGNVVDKDIEMAVLPKARPKYLKRAYDMADTEVMGYNASLLELKTNPERALQNEKNMFYPPSRFEGDEEVLKLVDKIRGENIPFSREDMEKNPRVGFKEGGMPKQMEMFEDGGLKDEGGEVDEESGNEVPPGSTKEEVRDDIPARLSEGEFVFPADVVRYLGLDFLMRLRQKAKAGLQRMEDMGQMGNSEEATLPDDIPFTIEDLEMEDDPVEMQVGGVVTNPLGNPTNMPNQVTTMNTPNVYNPSMGQMYTPGGVTPYAPASFKSLLPQSNLGQVKTENRKYKKGSQVRFVPFIVGTGQPLNPAQLAQLEADGFKLDTGTISPAEDKTKVKTAKVQPTDTSSGDDSGVTSTLGATLAIGGNKDLNRPGLQTNSTTFEIGYNVPGRLPGIASIAALPGILSGKAPEGTTVDFKKGNITKTVSYEDFLKIKNDVTGQFAKDFVSRVNDLDKLSKNQIVFDPEVGYKDTIKNETLTYEQITDPRNGLGKDIADRLEKETRDRSFLGFDVSTSATDAYNKLSDSEKSAYNDYVTESEEQEETRDTGFTSTAPSLSDIGTDLTDDTPDDDAPDDDSSAGTSVSDASEDPAAGFDFNQGGLLKRKPKVKKMKRGGLASR